MWKKSTVHLVISEFEGNQPAFCYYSGILVLMLELVSGFTRNMLIGIGRKTHLKFQHKNWYMKTRVLREKLERNIGKNISDSQ